MAIIELQDPLSTEIQSTTVSGAVDALNVISKGLDLGSELLEKVQMYPVEGLELSDPRRIYQVENGNRLWLSSPNEPVIYVNDSEISQSENEFSIDYIGGSITFGGDYRPGAEDVVTVSCAHISSQSKVYGGSEIKITFTPGFLGQQFTVTGGEDESYSGIVDSTYESTVRVKSVNTTYTVSANSIAGKNFTAKVEIGPYYGQYEVTLSSFSATIEITTEPTATVTVNGPANNYNATANGSGKATVIVAEAGTYSVTSTYKNANSDTKTVQVSSDGETYKTTNTFITLTVTVDAGSTVKVQNGSTTLTETSNGTVKFWLPNTGTWNVTATLGSQSASASVSCSSYKAFNVTIDYISQTLNSNSWQVISEVSSSGKAANYWEVGDRKTIILNGRVGYTTFNNVSVDAFIIGINHNASREGNNLVHFQIGKISGKNIALVDSKYDQPSGTGYFCMNTTNTTIVGWKSCYMRNTLYGNGSHTPTSPGTGTFLSVLPSDLRSVMKSASKYTNNEGTGSINNPSYITKTIDYLFNLSVFECFGDDKDFSDPAENGFQVQYQYYKSGNSISAYKYNDISSYAFWYTRSIYKFTSQNTAAFAMINSNSGSLRFPPPSANNSSGIRPCFVV